MSLRQQIQEDINKAIKAGRETECSVLRMLSASIANREKEKRYKLSKTEQNLKPEELEEKSHLSDEEVIQLIQSEIKKRKEAVSGFEKADRVDLVEKERKEIEILESYLPEQLSEQEIERLAKAVIERIGAKEPKDIGRVMKELMPEIKGKAPGGEVSRIVKKMLGK